MNNLLRLTLAFTACAMAAQLQAADPATDWTRSQPDVTVYLPKEGEHHDGDNEMFIVFKAPKSDELLGMWTQSTVEARGDNRIMLARSSDGRRWSQPQRIVGTPPGTKEPFHNNDGTRGDYSQWKTKWTVNQAKYLRHPAFIAVGEFRPKAHQPIWFSAPKQILDTQGAIIGPKKTAEIATYPSLTEWHGQRVLWYPDRKYYLLGKYLPDALLAGMKAPTATEKWCDEAILTHLARCSQISFYSVTRSLPSVSHSRLNWASLTAFVSVMRVSIPHS